jgi:hypothetical protein
LDHDLPAGTWSAADFSVEVFASSAFSMHARSSALSGLVELAKNCTG